MSVKLGFTRSNRERAEQISPSNSEIRNMYHFCSAGKTGADFSEVQ